VVSSSALQAEYTVKAGDALSLIAWRNGVRLTALLQANGLSATSLIMPGQRLRLPAPTRITPSAAPATATVAAAPSPNVKQGSSVQRMVSFAIAQVGAPYKFFSAGPETFDCSGLVVAAFREIGISVPHQSRALAKQGSSVDWRTEAIAAGDLVFTSAMNDPAMITHVGIAIDSTRWVHAVGVGRTVTIGSLPTDSKIMAVQRIAVP
jgi:peptidoglycan endopeptidase LytE